MRIKLNTLMAGPHGVHQRGAEIEVPPEVGEALLRNGAERVDDVPTVAWPVADRVTETATLEPRNLADRWRGKKRRRNEKNT